MLRYKWTSWPDFMNNHPMFIFQYEATSDYWVDTYRNNEAFERVAEFDKACREFAAGVHNIVIEDPEGSDPFDTTDYNSLAAGYFPWTPYPSYCLECI